MIRDLLHLCDLAIQTLLHIGHLLSKPLDLVLLSVSLGYKHNLVLGFALGNRQAIEEAIRVRHHVSRRPLRIEDARAQVVFAEDLVMRVDGAYNQYLPRDGGRVLSYELSSAAEG